MHLSRGRLQTGCKQGAPTPPARYSGCILGANRVHANFGMGFRHSRARQQQKYQIARRPSGQAMELDGGIAPYGITHLFSQRGNRRKSTAWLNWFGRETMVDEDFPTKNAKLCSENPSATPLVLEVSERQKVIYTRMEIKGEGCPMTTIIISSRFLKVDRSRFS
jgi:hypothetical protein